MPTHRCTPAHRCLVLLSTQLPKAALVAQAQQLESELFGGADELLERLDGDADEQCAADGALFAIDAYVRAEDGSTAGDSSVVVAPGQVGTQRAQRAAAQKRRPAWVDHDDGNAAVDIAAASRLRKLRKADGERVISGALIVPEATACRQPLEQRSWPICDLMRSKARQQLSQLTCIIGHIQPICPCPTVIPGGTGLSWPPLVHAHAESASYNTTQYIVQARSWRRGCGASSARCMPTQAGRGACRPSVTPTRSTRPPWTLNGSQRTARSSWTPGAASLRPL